MSDNHSQTVPVVRKIMAAYCRQTGEQNYLDTALRLVEHVHLALGKYSDTDPRSGWISGLDENAGCLHSRERCKCDTESQ